MDEFSVLEQCPKCGSIIDKGYIATRQGGGSPLLGGMKCSKIWFCDEFKMGFLGSPKGDDVSTANTHKKYMVIPAARCRRCNLVVFEYT